MLMSRLYKDNAKSWDTCESVESKSWWIHLDPSIEGPNNFDPNMMP